MFHDTSQQSNILDMNDLNDFDLLHGNCARHIVPSWVVSVPHMKRIHQIVIERTRQKLAVARVTLTCDIGHGARYIVTSWVVFGPNKRRIRLIMRGPLSAKANTLNDRCGSLDFAFLLEKAHAIRFHEMHVLCKFHENPMIAIWYKKAVAPSGQQTIRRTRRRTDGKTDRLTKPVIDLLSAAKNLCCRHRLRFRLKIVRDVFISILPRTFFNFFHHIPGFCNNNRHQMNPKS